MSLHNFYFVTMWRLGAEFSIEDIYCCICLPHTPTFSTELVCVAACACTVCACGVWFVVCMCVRMLEKWVWHQPVNNNSCAHDQYKPGMYLTFWRDMIYIYKLYILWLGIAA